jgi:hypothetical protein
MPGLSPAADALGLGGVLRDQVKDMTEEERKKRMQEEHQRALTGLPGSPATMALFGRAYGQGA